MFQQSVPYVIAVLGGKGQPMILMVYMATVLRRGSIVQMINRAMGT